MGAEMKAGILPKGKMRQSQCWAWGLGWVGAPGPGLSALAQEAGWAARPEREGVLPRRGD